MGKRSSRRSLAPSTARSTRARPPQMTTCVCVCVCARARARVRVCVCVSIYVSIYLYMYVCVYMYVRARPWRMTTGVLMARTTPASSFMTTCA